MELRKAGECLSYGLGNELINNEDLSDKYNLNLKAFVTYFALMGYLSNDTVARIQKALEMEVHKSYQRKNLFIQLSKPVIRDLKKKYVFNDFDQLIGELDNIEIPSWVFETKGVLLKLFPQVYLVHELLYYMVEDKGRYYFRCIHVNYIEDLLEFSRDFSVDFDIDMVPYSEINHTISTRYSEIIGFSEETMTFYMRYRHADRMYVEYHADSKQEIIHRYRCFGVINNKIPVVEANNVLSLVVGNEIKKIKDIDIREDYEVKDGYIYAYPSYCVPTMFRPYVVTLDGARVEISQNEAAAYVIEKVKSDIRDFRRFSLHEEEEKLKTGEYKEDIIFSLDYFDSFLTGRYDMEEDKEARIYHFIVKLLEVYLPTDKDVLDYFFLLSDVSKRLTKRRNIYFIGEGLYWRLIELHLAGKLSCVIKDKYKLKKKLLQDVYWDDDAINDIFGERILAEYVGYFSIANGMIEAQTEELDNAVCVGDMLFAKWLDRPGVVAYNLETGAYVIQYNRELADEEIQLILNTYHIVDVAYCISIDKNVSSLGGY